MVVEGTNCPVQGRSLQTRRVTTQSLPLLLPLNIEKRLAPIRIQIFATSREFMTSLQYIEYPNRC